MLDLGDFSDRSDHLLLKNKSIKYKDVIYPFNTSQNRLIIRTGECSGLFKLHFSQIVYAESVNCDV